MLVSDPHAWLYSLFARLSETHTFRLLSPSHQFELTAASRPNSRDLRSDTRTPALTAAALPSWICGHNPEVIPSRRSSSSARRSVASATAVTRSAASSLATGPCCVCVDRQRCDLAIRTTSLSQFERAHAPRSDSFTLPAPPWWVLRVHGVAPWSTAIRSAWNRGIGNMSSWHRALSCGCEQP